MAADRKKPLPGVLAKSRKTGAKTQPPSLPTQTKHGGGAVRIASGKYKRTPLAVDDRAGLRPTPSRVRETVFDWLRHLTGGLAEKSVLDMFSGSGAMGLEAASNGAARVICVEKDRRSAAGIRSVAQKIGASEVEVKTADVFDYLNSSQDRFDIIFIDPPFSAGLYEAALQTAVAHLAHEGYVYVEAEQEISGEFLERFGLEAVRRSCAGAVFFLLAAAKTR